MEHTTTFSIGNEGREVFWNAQHFEPILFLLTAVALAIFAYGVYRRWQMWKALGKSEIRWDSIGQRIKLLLKDGLLQVKTWRDPYPGIMHGLIFFGFFVLLFGAIFDAGEFHITEPLFNWSFLRGNFYLGFSFLMEVFGLCVLIGILLALFRRYVLKPERLGYKGKPDHTADDAIALLLILGIIVTGFLISALRIHVTYQQAPWERIRFVSWGIAYALANVETSTTLALHKIMWWTHTLIALSFIAYIPYSRLLHMITTSVNHFLLSLQPTGYLEPIRDFENAEAFGAGKLEDFTWKQIFDSDACTRCGRCQDGCPAYLSGKPLSPKKVIQDIKTFWLEKAPAAIKAKAAAAAETPVDAASGKALVGEVIDLHELWACTNCMYCMEHC